MEFLHPAAIKMKGAQRNPSLQHTVDKTHHRLFVIAGGKGGRQPQSKGPGRGQGGLAGDIRISHEHFLHGRAVKQHIVQIAPLHGELRPGHHLRAQFHGYLFRMVHQHSVPLVGYVKRNIFICLLGAGASVSVPDVDALAVPDKGSEMLPRAVEQFPHSQRQLLAHISVLIVSPVVILPLPVGLHQRQVSSRTAGQQLSVSFIGHGPGFFSDFQGQMPALYGDNILRLRYLQRTFLQIQFKSRFLHHRPQVMPGLHPEHIHPGGSDLHGQIDSAQGCALAVNMAGGRADTHLRVRHFGKIGLGGREAPAAFLL